MNVFLWAEMITICRGEQYNARIEFISALKNGLAVPVVIDESGNRNNSQTSPAIKSTAGLVERPLV